MYTYLRHAAIALVFAFGFLKATSYLTDQKAGVTSYTTREANIAEAESFSVADRIATAPIAQTPKLIEYTVRAGDTISSIWTKLGGPSGGYQQITKAMSAVGLSARSLKAGEILKYIKDHLGEIVEIHKPLDAPKTLILKGDSKTGYTPIINEPVVVIHERPVTGTIKRSFSESALDLEIPYSVIDNYVDLFAGRVEFRRDLQPGDEFTVNYQEQRLENGDLVGPGQIIGATLKNGGKILAAVCYEGRDGKTRYFDEDGEALGNFFLRYPLNFSRISSSFSTSRFHPVLKHRRPHSGVDFAAPTGTAVRAVADGVITLAGWNGGGGRMIKVQHGSRYATAYLHLSQIVSGIKRGARVKRGQVIGKVGMTGLATGPHLHFSFYDRGRYVDPLSIKLPKMEEGKDAKIPKDFLAKALESLYQLHT